ncbi:MAG: hypothetical protein U1D30_22265 [Planctomycetota bacterium]
MTIQGSSIKHWWNGQAIKLLLAYNFGLIAAVGVCLPSFYFYGLLAGVRMSMLEVAVLAMRVRQRPPSRLLESCRFTWRPCSASR